jgi:hypothetical protein
MITIRDTVEIKTLMGRRLAALQQHMVEEGRNPKLVLEKGTL